MAARARLGGGDELTRDRLRGDHPAPGRQGGDRDTPGQVRRDHLRMPVAHHRPGREFIGPIGEQPEDRAVDQRLHRVPGLQRGPTCEIQNAGHVSEVEQDRGQQAKAAGIQRIAQVAGEDRLNDGAQHDGISDQEDDRGGDEQDQKGHGSSTLACRGEVGARKPKSMVPQT